MLQKILKNFLQNKSYKVFLQILFFFIKIVQLKIKKLKWEQPTPHKD
jgi:hypothetical protein